MLDTWQRLALGRGAAAQLVGHDYPWHALQAAQQLAEEPLGGTGVAPALNRKSSERYLAATYVDQGYTADAAAAIGIALHIVKLPKAKRGFTLLSGCWIMERSFARDKRCRRLVKDYKRDTATLTGFYLIALFGYMLRHAADLMEGS